jgi:hypothetical protein
MNGVAAGAVDAMRAYCHLGDPDLVLVAIAAAATSVRAGDPLWLMVVGPPSSGKTEVLRALNDCADAHMDEVTAAGFLSWTPARGKQTPRPTGVLTRIGPRALVTIGDFSTLLAGSDKGLRDTTFALMRRLYDGSVRRDLGNAPEPLEWEGRLTLLAAVTPAIDNYSSHNSALGDRWMYFRLPELTGDDAREAVTKAQRAASDVERHRAAAAEMFATAVADARLLVDRLELGQHAEHRIADIAIAMTVGRVSVPRSGYGKREVVGEATREERMRLAKQLSLLHSGLVAAGLDEFQALRIVQRVGLDTMPLTRRKVLGELSDGERLTAAEIGRRTGCDRKIVRFALEDLSLVGATRYAGQDTDDDEPNSSTVKRWSLAGEHVERIALIFNSDRKLRRGTKSGYPPPASPEEGRQVDGSDPPFVPRLVDGGAAQ